MVLMGRKTFRHSGPPVSIVQEESVKRIVTVVPVESDGSVYFVAPSGKALYCQLLDEKYRALQTMRSFTGLMPGEQRGCVGCHENQAVTPQPQPSMALKRPPTPITPPPWGDQSIGYETFVQPVLDRYCGECKLIEISSSGKHPPSREATARHAKVKEDPLNLRRLIAWVDAVCPYMTEEKIRDLGDPEFPGIERLPIRPRVATAPRIERP